MAIGQKLEMLGIVKAYQSVKLQNLQKFVEISSPHLKPGILILNCPVYLLGLYKSLCKVFGIDPESAVADLNLEIGFGEK